MLQIQPKTILLGHWERNSRSNSHIKEILDELEFFKHYCHRALAISKDEDIEIHLKKQPNSCFANNYFDVDLKAWQVNTDIHIFLRMSKRQCDTCVEISQKLKINVQEPWNKQPKKLWEQPIFMAPWKDLLKIT